MFCGESQDRLRLTAPIRRATGILMIVVRNLIGPGHASRFCGGCRPGPDLAFPPFQILAKRGPQALLARIIAIIGHGNNRLRDTWATSL